MADGRLSPSAKSTYGANNTGWSTVVLEVEWMDGIGLDDRIWVRLEMSIWPKLQLTIYAKKITNLQSKSQKLPSAAFKILFVTTNFFVSTQIILSCSFSCPSTHWRTDSEKFETDEITEACLLKESFYIHSTQCVSLSNNFLQSYMDFSHSQWQLPIKDISVYFCEILSPQIL